MVAITAPRTFAAVPPGLHAVHETLSRDALAALQLERLRATLRNAWDHVPWQRARIESAGTVPFRAMVCTIGVIMVWSRRPRGLSRNGPRGWRAWSRSTPIPF